MKSGVGTAESSGEELGFELNDEKEFFFKKIFLACDLFSEFFGLLQTYPT